MKKNDVKEEKESRIINPLTFNYYKDEIILYKKSSKNNKLKYDYASYWNWQIMLWLILLGGILVVAILPLYFYAYLPMFVNTGKSPLQTTTNTNMFLEVIILGFFLLVVASGILIAFVGIWFYYKRLKLKSTIKNLTYEGYIPYNNETIELLNKLKILDKINT